MRRLLLALPVAFFAASCVSNLPAQDLRILTAQPAAKLSASDLWKDFEADASAARSRYFGKAIDVSDSPTGVEPNSPSGARMLFAQAGERGVIARLLDDRATQTLKDAKAGSRLTLRCFCQGLDDKRDVILKSCIKP